MEKIKAASIKFQVLGESQIQYMSGFNHAQCIEGFSCIYLYANKRNQDIEESGFLTTNNRFVDRTEALNIAKQAKQVSKDYPHDVLYSEFIEW